MLSLYLSSVHEIESAQEGLTLTNDCPCPGHNVTFECTFVGGGTTVWQGNGVFNCPIQSNEVILQHFNFDSALGECNNGEIVGESLRVDAENIYTSQLNILYKENYGEKNISCLLDNGITITRQFSSMITQDILTGIGSKL